MSGGVYTVWGAARFAPFPTCPDELRGATIRLKPSDGDAVEVEAEAACMAAKVIKIALAKGADYEIPCPMSKGVLGKIVEYMKFHEKAEPGNLKIPLVGETLLECGASKWDEKFISSDKGQFLELLYAATALDMPGLVLLAVSKAALMMRGKSLEKIRKEYGLADDLPKGEESSLTGAMGRLRDQQRLYAEDGGLGAYAVLMHGVHAAAAKYGALRPDGAEEAKTPTIDLKSWRVNAWSAAVTEDWTHIKSAPPEVRGHKQLVLSAMPPSRGSALAYASDALKADKEVVLAAVACRGTTLAEAATGLRGDREVVMEAIMLDGTALAGATDDLRGDRNFILAAAKQGRGSALRGATEALKGDMGFVLDCASLDAEAVVYAAEALRSSRDFALAAVQVSPKALQYLPSKFKADMEVVRTAASGGGDAIAHAHASRRQDLDGAPLKVSFAVSLKEPPRAPLFPGVPLTWEAAEAGLVHRTVKTQKIIYFTALSTITANMGQSNYIASNSYMDKLQQYERPEIDGIGIGWGTVGGMGMRWKAFASQDFMNATPHLLLSIDDCCKILHMVSTRMDPPELFYCNLFDEGMRNMILAPTAGTKSASETAAPKQSEKARVEPMAQAPSDPLGGWPGLDRTALYETPVVLPLVKGTRVRLVGMKTWNNMTGTILKDYPEGKCRVALDQMKGHALLKSEHLQAIPA